MPGTTWLLTMVHNDNMVSTKFLPPVYRGALVGRPKLDNVTKRLPVCPVTLISAPAGYGKTTLMSAWYKHLREQGIAACWISLEGEEGSETALLTYLIGSLAQAKVISGLEARSKLSGWQKNRSAEVVAALIGEIIAIDQTIVLFLDDYHLVDNPDTAGIIENLIAVLPENLYLVIASRKQPRFSVGKLKVQNRLREFNINNLRFSTNNVAEFLERQLGEPLSEDIVETLARHTEGWPAGLQLVALSLVGSDDYHHALEKFSGNVRDIADYLAKDVLAKLAPEIQQFLLCTAILRRLHPNLCDTLNPGFNSRDILEQCVRQNLFVIPLDDADDWYRYHYLFREFLLNQLVVKYPEKLTELHSRASRWLAERGLIDDAIAHAIEAQDYPFLVELVETHARRFMARGHMSQVLDWANRIPVGLAVDRPVIPMLKCWALFHMRRPTEAAEALREAERQMAGLEARGEPVAPALQDELQVLRCGVAVAADDVREATKFGLMPIPAVTDAFVRGVQQNILGYCYFAQSRYQQAREALARGYNAHRECDSTYGMVYSHCFAALVEMAEGSLTKAEQLFSLAEKTAELEESWRTYISAEPSLYRGYLLYEWNRLDEAYELIEQNLSHVEECGQASAPVLGHIAMAQLCRRRKQLSNAHLHLDRAQAICQSANLNHLRLLVVSEQVRQMILDGQLYRAIAAANLLGVQVNGKKPEEIPPDWNRGATWKLLIKSRLLLGLGEYRAALALLEELIPLARQATRCKPLLQLMLMKLNAQLCLQMEEQAIETLGQALESGAVGPYISLFEDEAPFLPKLYGKLDRSLLSTAASTFLEHLENPGGEIATVAGSSEGVNKLSDREVGILRLISQGSTNQQIAGQLFIAENTVKWHLKNIFDKLEVRNRTSAVFVAKELGIIN